MKSDIYNYIHIPICLLQLVHQNPKPKYQRQVLMEIFKWAIVNRTNHKRYEKEALVKHIIYLYYKNPDILLDDIIYVIEELENNGNFERDELDGFNYDGKFCPADDIMAAVSEVIENDEDFRENCLNQYLIGGELTLFKIKWTVSQCISEFTSLNEHLIKSEKKYGQDAWASIRVDIFMDAFKGIIFLNEFLIYVAVRSIIGKSNFKRTTKMAIVSRMMGVKITSKLDEVLKNNELSIQTKDKYLIRYHFNKLKDQVVIRRLVTIISTGRVFFVSIRFSPEELWKKLIERKEKNTKRKDIDKKMLAKYRSAN